MDSLEIEGKEYISAKRAAREHSYTMDYIGQLIRGGKLIGRKVGRAWYVEQDSLSAYIAALLRVESSPVSENQAEERADATVLDQSENSQEDAQKVAEEATEPASTEKEKASPVPETGAPRTQPTYNYQMLNYVRGDEKEVELIPTLDTKDEQPIALRKEYGTGGAVAPQLERQARSVWPNAESVEIDRRIAGTQRTHLPMKRPALLPAVLGTALILIAVMATSFATFFTKAIQYEGATASVTQSIKYESIFE